MLSVTVRYKTIPILLILAPHALLLHFASKKLEHGKDNQQQAIETTRQDHHDVATVDVRQELRVLLNELPRGLLVKIEINAWTTTIRKL